MRKRSATKWQQHEIGHEGVITGRDVFSLRSSIANPQGVSIHPNQLICGIRFNKCHRQFSVMC
ncbi:hypothetical protein [Lysinibacillus sp. NPDC056232]|uniref:hypothetical protein n=1 Tax=Lysinibacillus sp. NPDC056232 TaxID=3345756 RepID=UPI0035E2A761